MDITFHYPPELFQLLVDAIPKLCKSKSALLLFFQGAGVPQTILQPYEVLLSTNKTAFNKYPVTRELLTKLNATIVDGPGEFGQYRIGIKSGSELEAKKAIQNSGLVDEVSLKQ